ncbi:MAG: hypothetical protein NTY88_08730 [Bacteroidetes bacterium]|nr:hypothetical protein [Bacteroidota bacterium]
MMKKILFLHCILIAALCSFAQSNYSYWENVYTDETVTVEVAFQMSSNSCTGAKNKFAYRISGSLSTSPKYVNWKMIFRDCSNHTVYLLNSVSIGPDGELNKTIESPEYSFSGTWLADKFKNFKPSVAAYPFVNSTPQPLPLDWGVGIVIALITGRQKVCSGESVYLLSKVVATSTALYQWQTSADGKIWNNLAGKTSSDCRTDAINTTTYIRCHCKDEATGIEQTTNELMIAVVEPVVTVSGNSSVCNGGVAIVAASSTDGVTGATYHWQISNDGKEWKEADANTSASFKTPPLQAETFLRCIYKPGSGFCKETTSDIFSVSVGQGSSVTAVGNTTICAGGMAELTSSVAEKNAAGTYQWQLSADNQNWMNIASGVSQNHTTEPLFSTTHFRVLFSAQVAGCAANASNDVLVKVIEVPRVTAKGDAIIHMEKTVSLKAKAVWSAGDASYQWQESNNQKTWKDVVGAIASSIKSPRITSTTYYRCSYKSPISGCEVVSNIVSIAMPEKQEKVLYSDEKIWVSRLHNPKKLLHLGIDAGLGFHFQPLNVAYRQFPDSSASLSAKALGIHAGFIFHQVMKDFASLGFSLSGDVGTTPLLFTGFKTNKSGNAITEKYLASKFNFGTEAAFGYWALKVLLKYNISMQSHKFTRTEDDGVAENNFIASDNFRKETIGVGFRVGPYSARKRANIPYNVDFLVTLANDYKFNWAGQWTYQSISGWQVGIEAGVWLQSYFKLGFGVNFYDGGKTYLFPDTKNHTTAFLKLTYARDWFK